MYSGQVKAWVRKLPEAMKLSMPAGMAAAIAIAAGGTAWPWAIARSIRLSTLKEAFTVPIVTIMNSQKLSHTYCISCKSHYVPK